MCACMSHTVSWTYLRVIVSVNILTFYQFFDMDIFSISGGISLSFQSEYLISDPLPLFSVILWKLVSSFVLIFFNLVLKEVWRRLITRGRVGGLGIPLDTRHRTTRVTDWKKCIFFSLRSNLSNHNFFYSDLIFQTTSYPKKIVESINRSQPLFCFSRVPI